MNTEIPTVRRAVFRCDGGTGIGFGHVTRCLALAEVLAGLGWSCGFAVTSETAALDVLQHSPFGVSILGEPFKASSLAGSSNIRTDLLVIDHYGLDKTYESACRSWADRILVLDDAPGRKHDADILLDSTYSRRASAYAPFVSMDCRLLLGPDYNMLRSEFSRYKEQALEHHAQSEKVERIFMSFGGADSHGLTLEALTALERINDPLIIDIAIGSNASHLTALEKQSAASRHRVKVHRDCARIGKLLAMADIALGAGGINAWERCALGVPSIMVCAADNQRGTYDAIANAGASIGVGILGSDTSSVIGDALERIINDKQLRQKMSLQATAMCDGLGAYNAGVAIESHVSQQAKSMVSHQ